jgi:hypothetical protein
MDGRPNDSLDLDPEDGRDGIGENFCQPPLPPSRAGIELAELPGLGAEPLFELPRVSGRVGELFLGPVERDCAMVFCPDWLKRRNPLFELALDLKFELALPGLATSRPFPVNRPAGRLLFDICDCPRPNDRDAAPEVPRAEKKCWFCDTCRMVEAAAGRPLAEKLSRLGVMGTLPFVKRAFWNCA